MKEREEKYEKRTQKDYSMPFKLSVVREIETTSIGLSAVARKYGIQSETTVKRWLEKYGTFDWENIKGKEMPKTKEQEIMELRQKLLLLRGHLGRHGQGRSARGGRCSGAHAWPASVCSIHACRPSSCRAAA